MYINMYEIFNSLLLKIKTLFTLDNSNRKATIRVSNNTHTSGQILESFLICNNPHVQFNSWHQTKHKYTF